MTSKASIDDLRTVPEIACRIYLGAEVSRENGSYVIRLDGREYRISPEAFAHADRIAKTLTIRDRRVEYASDVLELRHAAEDFFLEDLLGRGGAPKILFLPAGEMASAFYRAMIPSDLLLQSGSAIAQHTLRLDLAKAVRYSILWIQLAASPLIIDTARAAQATGVKVVYDVDDKFDSIPAHNPSSRVYTKDKVACVWELIELADLVTVSTRPLADHVSTRAKRVRVIPNYIPTAVWPRAARRGDGVFRILWAGSQTHAEDLSLIAPPLAKILKRAKGKARFTLFGEAMPEALECVRAHIDLMPFVPFSEYAYQLTRLEADLALAPLVDDEFNRYKSAVKHLEYSACGYPTLMSPVGEYAEIAKAGAPGILVAPGEWEDAIQSAMADRDAIRTMGNEARGWACANRCIIAAQAKPWLDAAKDILDSGKRNGQEAKPC